MAARKRRRIKSHHSVHYTGDTDWYISSTFKNSKEIQEYKRVANILRKITKFKRSTGQDSRKAIIEDRAFTITKYPDGPMGISFYSKLANHRSTR
jgi:hypothetical protein